MKYYFQILLLILIISSCSKNKNYQTPLNIEFKSTEGIELITQNNNSFRIPPNCFEDKDGKDYNGKVNFVLIEVFSKEDMIKNDLTTSSNGKMLVSGGMFFLSAKSENGGNLRIKESESIGLCAQLGIDEYKYERFYGVRGEEGFNWIPETERESRNSSTNGEFYHSHDCLSSYVFNINKLGWINCDYFEEGVLEGNIVLNSLERNLNVRLVFKELNSIMEFRRYEDSFELEGLPLNRKAKIIAYKESNSKIEFYEKEITIDSLLQFEIALEDISVEDFTTKIKNL